MASAQYELSEPPTDVISAVKYAPNSGTRLLVSSWDRHIYIYETPSPLEASEGHLVMRIEHRAPVLDICFGEDDDTAFSAGLDHDVNMINLETGHKTVLSTHDEGVRRVVYSHEHHMLVSASWDKTLHIHIMSGSDLAFPVATLPLPDKPHCISLSATRLVVATANKEILVYDLAALAAAASAPDANIPLTLEPMQHREPALKYMTRALACHPEDTGFAISSIEGRIGVEFFDPSPEAQAGKYAFRCHRTATEDEDIVYPVNAVAFNPVRTSHFASGGGDAAIFIWDATTKRRVRQFAGFAGSIAALDWSPDGKTLAVGTSPGFEDGNEELDTMLVKVYIKSVPEGDAKARSKK